MRMSSPTSSTFFPWRAMAAAVFIEMNDFPSPDCEDVTITTLWSFPLRTNCRLVRTSLNSSTVDDVLLGVTTRLLPEREVEISPSTVGSS